MNSVNFGLVSIIIPTYNRAHLIGETLDSIIAQTYTHWECIVVDDGSTDGTKAVVNNYILKDKRFSLYNRPLDRPKGGNAARNYGFLKAKGEYVQFFDSDDIMMPAFIKEKQRAFKTGTGLIISTGFMVDHNLKNPKKIELKWDESVSLFSQYVLWNLKIMTPSILFKKEFLLNKSLFSETIIRGQETELFSRLFFDISVHQYTVINIPLFLYRQHPATKTAKNQEYRKDFKASQTIIHLTNFERAIHSRDKTLAQYLYKNLIKLFLSGVANEHKTNVNLIVTKLGLLLYRVDVFKAIKFYTLCYLYQYIYKSNSIRLQLKNFHFKL